MGNENSLLTVNKGFKGVVDKFGSKIMSTEMNSEYNGVKTCEESCDINYADTDEEENPKFKLNLYKDSSTGNLCDKEIKLPTKFEWKEGGRVVFLSGSFNNWSDWLVMNKLRENIFELVLVLLFNNYILTYFKKLLKS